MADLTTNHMGIELKNPLILGASNLVSKIDNLKKAEDAGIAAIVYRSLFEEQIQLEDYQMGLNMEAYDDRHAEMTSIFPNLEHAGPKEHLLKLRKAKESISIPLIASLNAVFKETWVDYAKQIEESGVDGLELNFFSVPRDATKSGHDVILEQIDFLKAVKAAVKIPVSVKLSPFYTNILKTTTDISNAGADGLILFNRLFEPDIDVEAEKHTAPWNLSTSGDHRISIRYIGMLSGNISSSLTANSGIYKGSDIAKMILAGSDSVEAVSTFYHNGLKYATEMLKELEMWMTRKGYHSLDEFRAKLSNNAVNDPFVYKRAQYIDMMLKSEEFFDPAM